MKPQFRLPRLSPLALGLLILGLIPLTACEQLRQLTATSPESPAASPSPASPGPASPGSAASPSPAAPASPAASPAPSPAAQAPASPAPSPAASPAPSPAAQAPASPAPSPAVNPMAQNPAAANSIAAIAASNPGFSTLNNAINAAGLTETLSQPGNFTVFAPTNEAFNELPPDLLQALLQNENRALLTKILTYHVVPQKVTAAQIKSIDLPTVEGQPIKMRPVGNEVKINEATVTQTDISASNGVVHVINKVLLPPGFSPSQLK